MPIIRWRVCEAHLQVVFEYKLKRPPSIIKEPWLRASIIGIYLHFNNDFINSNSVTTNGLR